MSDKEFWKCTPRKLTTLLDVHIEMNTSRDEQKDKKEKKVFIDQIAF
jgi:hypothetical protein